MWHGVITNVGKTAIEEHLASGVGLNLNVVKTGTATVPAANMRAMTGMSAQADTGSIIGKKGTTNGAEVQISVQASESRYVMKEIGLFATLADESEVLIAYYNDDGIGVEVPAVADFPDFNYILFCLLDIINADDLTITMDSTHAVLISQIENSLTTPADTEGKVLDARQGKILSDQIANTNEITTLFTGLLYEVNGEGTLSESVMNFHFVLIRFMTNSEYQTILIPTDGLEVGANARVFSCTIQASGASGQVTYPLSYNSTILVRFTENTKIKVTGLWYNNVNYTTKVNKVYGINRKTV